MKKAQFVSFVIGMLTIALQPAMAAPSQVESDGETSSATLTEAKGNVYKRGFVDWSRQQWGDPQSAKVGDVLQEGMQVGTGEKSWAQIAWHYVTCRAWANSVYAIAPHQRLVYLTNGEMLFHLSKNRKDKDDFCVWTNLLQARIRGTTVVVQTTADSSRISVLEGTVDVLNKLDHSVVRIKPGVVYTVHAKPGAIINDDSAPPKPGAANGTSDPHTANSNSLPGASNMEERNIAATPGTLSNTINSSTGTPSAVTAATLPVGNSASQATSLSELTNIASSRQGEIPLFDDSRSTTSLFVADVDALLAHPLVKDFESVLSSAPLVEGVLNALPGVFHGGASQEGTTNLLSLVSFPGRSELQSAVEVLRAPTRVSYNIGPQVGTREADALISITPVTAALFPPQGLIGTAISHDLSHFTQTLAGGQLHFLQSGHRIVSLSDPILRLPAPDLVTSPQLPGGISLPGATSVTGDGITIAGRVLVSPTFGNLGIVGGAPILPGASGQATQSTLNSILAGRTIGSTGSGAGGVGTFGGLGGVVGGVPGTGTGVLGGVGGLVGGVGTTLGGTVSGLGNTVGGVVTGLGGTVSGLGNTLGGTLGGTVSGLGGTVSGLGGTLGGTVGGLGGTLGGALGGHGGGLGGLLGGGHH